MACAAYSIYNAANSMDAAGAKGAEEMGENFSKMVAKDVGKKAVKVVGAAWRGANAVGCAACMVSLVPTSSGKKKGERTARVAVKAPQKQRPEKEESR